MVGIEENQSQGFPPQIFQGQKEKEDRSETDQEEAFLHKLESKFTS